MKYILKKEYPGSPKLGNTIDNLENDWIENYPEFWQEVVEKDYEILSFINVNNKIYELRLDGRYFNDELKYNDYKYCLEVLKIHSVKRLSDSQIFTIGDKVFTEYVNYTINKIDIVNDKCMVTALYDTNNPNGSRFHYNLNNLKKAKQPLFTTEDGVDIFEGDNLYSIDNMLNIRKHLLFNARYDDNTLLNNRIFFNSDYKHFSTKEKAEEYILMNKPLLSLSDVWDNLKVKDQKEVMKFVKSKLNK